MQSWLSQGYPSTLLSANKSESGNSENQVCSAKTVARERASMKSKRESDRARNSEVSLVEAMREPCAELDDVAVSRGWVSQEPRSIWKIDRWRGERTARVEVCYEETYP